VRQRRQQLGIDEVAGFLGQRDVQAEDPGAGQEP
jgi:hypothetical protein